MTVHRDHLIDKHPDDALIERIRARIDGLPVAPETAALRYLFDRLVRVNQAFGKLPGGGYMCSHDLHEVAGLLLAADVREAAE